MNMVEFRITERTRESEGILEIGRRMHVTCLEGNRFLVAEEGLGVLDRLSIPYTVLAREPFNYERHALSHLISLLAPSFTPGPSLLLAALLYRDFEPGDLALPAIPFLDQLALRRRR